MAIERRKERRIKVDLPVSIISKNSSQIKGTIENISRLGAYAEIDKDIPIGEDIDITFKIPIYSRDSFLCGEVSCKGNIFRSGLTKESRSRRYYGVGIFFTNFAKQLDRDKLSEYINYLILKEGRDVQAGIKRWREKRVMGKKNKQTQKINLSQEDFQAKAFGLLNQILVRLEEISRLLQSQGRTK